MGMNEEAIEEQDDPFSALRTEERARHEITWPLRAKISPIPEEARLTNPGSFVRIHASPF